ncbi:MAG: fibronectin type III domain-containing protein [Terriglobales bacterium]
MRTRLFTIVAVLALAALLACGIPGAPQPPSLELPRTVGNLQAVRKGDRVTLTWTTPHETTDRKRIKHLGVTRVCRAVDRVAVAECVERVGTLPPEHTPLAAAASFTDTLPKPLQETHASGFATYAVAVENARGKNAGLSNQVTVPLAPTLPPPSRISAKVTAEGVEISASGKQGPRLPAGLHSVFHLYRRSQGSPNTVDLGEPLSAEAIGFGHAMNFFDRTAEWEKTYLYKIAAVTVEPVQGKEERVEGDDSSEIEVFVHDVFPPAVPTGLQAVSAGTAQQPFIDLSWTPDTESDLAGYNVYRHEEAAAPVKMNSEVVKAPTYRDTAVQAGRRYSYSVSAVDVRGNESERSTETSEAVQQ